jgi:hypothetical protein
MNNMNKSPEFHFSINKKVAEVGVSLIMVLATRFGVNGLGNPDFFGNMFGYANGQEVVTTKDTNCFQCPGGDDMSRRNQLNCAYGQTNWGTIPAGTVLEAEAGPYDLGNPNDGAYTRVGNGDEDILMFSINPMNGEKIDLNREICWVPRTNLKAVEDKK